VVVFLKTSEEATCDMAVCKTWTYTGVIPTLTSVVTSFDTTSLQWKVTATGTDITGDASTTELELSNIAQTTTSVSTTEAVFTITNVTTQTLVDSALYFDIGLPENHNLVAT